MGARGRRPDGHRGAARLALVVAVVLVAVTLVTGAAAAAPAQPGAVPAAPAAAPDDAGDDGDDGPGDDAGDDGDQDAPVPPPPPCLPTARACVDLSTAHAWLLDAGRVVRGPVRITPGHESTPTPRGEFGVQWKARTYTSREYNRPMPWSVFFADGGVAFHEGSPDTFSAGCVKLGADDARAFFEFLQVGDRVQVV
jgi:hypothetical protein